jgi:hypothetical protein
MPFDTIDAVVIVFAICAIFIIIADLKAGAITGENQ